MKSGTKLYEPKPYYLYLLCTVLIILLVLDSLFLGFYDIGDKKWIQGVFNLHVYDLIIVVSLFLQLIVVICLRKLVKQIIVRTRINTKLIDLTMFTYYSFLIMVSSILAFQIFQNNFYSTILLTVIVTISHLTALLLMGKILYLFVSWYRRNRNIIFLSLSIVISIIILNIIVSMAVVYLVLIERPDRSTEYTGGTINPTGDKYALLNTSNRILSMGMFGGIWFITGLVLYKTKEKLIKKVLKLNFLFLPILYVMFNYFTYEFLEIFLFNYVELGIVQVYFFMNLLLIISQPMGGLIFGLVLWNIGRLLSFEKTLRLFLILSALGFLFLFSSFQSIYLTALPYPPYGIITLTLLVLGSYLITNGFYITASFLSDNNQLRRMIYQKAKSDLLDLMGKAELEKGIERLVSELQDITERKGNSETIRFEMDEFELKKYLEVVLTELDKH